MTDAHVIPESVGGRLSASFLCKRCNDEMGRVESLLPLRFDHFVRVASAVTGDVESGRDAVQSAFAAAVRGRKTFRGSGPAEGWVWKIVINEAYRVRRDRPSTSPIDVDEASANGHAAEDVLGLRAFIAALPERQRAALFLRYYADLDYRAIAEILGVEVGTVSATLSAAHTTLRKTLRRVEG